uniref:Uncharacterized protein n=1 Tax=Chlamydomonas euryale TaxID=1486919 RepID=A0A7R9YU66_9CHLO
MQNPHWWCLLHTPHGWPVLHITHDWRLFKVVYLRHTFVEHDLGALKELHTHTRSPAPCGQVLFNHAVICPILSWTLPGSSVCLQSSAMVASLAPAAAAIK